MFYVSSKIQTDGNDNEWEEAFLKRFLKKRPFPVWRNSGRVENRATWQLHETGDRHSASTDNLSASIKTAAVPKNTQTEDIITRARSHTLDCEKSKRPPTTLYKTHTALNSELLLFFNVVGEQRKTKAGSTWKIDVADEEGIRLCVCTSPAECVAAAVSGVWKAARGPRFALGSQAKAS